MARDNVGRIVRTGFWTNPTVMNKFTPEDKLFMLYLMTNPHTSQSGVYHLPLKMAAVEIGYSHESVLSLIDRFKNKYGLIEYNYNTEEIAVLGYMRHSVIKGGKPVMDCMLKEETYIEDKTLLLDSAEYLRDCPDLNATVIEYIDHIFITYSSNNNKDNDNERYVNDSYHDSSDTPAESRKQDTNVIRKAGSNIPPTVEEVREYCHTRGNSVDAERFCDFYESKGWKVGKEKMKNWQAAVRTWESKDKPVSAKSSTENNNGPIIGSDDTSIAPIPGATYGGRVWNGPYRGRTR